ncbi:MAG TPA: tyrosine-protein phosphatase [Phycisphaerae bacterium]|jgi:protein tyrosine/serine phosphatase|nr:dual specificity protein phosphatase family protein [Phycisphaerae bacterium]HOB74100.1 tyrosine-protein phosphatase [Phycisphaerae bacterium]HOJ56118.1 tyrosine-protein phosphatase [Phycisphaerae bacterium]HOL28032.1 tyrosine-protein phosphatase [Phycisphaerae bacterium]HPP22292.1 tyrosine-protein phosphatase [Phycisphaerae bacterium]
MRTSKLLNRRAALSVAFLALAPVACIDAGLPAGALPYNFDVLDDGQVYRTSQPTADHLETIIDTYGIRTVLNLRGENPGSDWYDAEKAVCEARGVTLISYPMSAKSLPSADVLASVIETLKTAEYPLLIHCNGGADRTGAVSAIYRMLILGEDRKAALAELSPAHLHFRSYAPCMDTLAEMYEPTPEWLEWYAANVEQIQCR